MNLPEPPVRQEIEGWRAEAGGGMECFSKNSETRVEGNEHYVVGLVLEC